MAGSFDEANRAEFCLDYRTTTALGSQAHVTTECANDGTMTQPVHYPLAILQPTPVTHHGAGAC
jgi:hypothetical protein